MKKILLGYACLAFLVAGCSTNKSSSANTTDEGAKPYLELIQAEQLRKHLFIVASDEMEGRNTGEPGQKKAGEYLINQYKKMGVSYPKRATSYYQPIPSEFFKKAFSPKLGDSENIWAFIEGTEKPDEILVISATLRPCGYEKRRSI